MKKFMACLLVLCMMLGTCTSAFAVVDIEDEVAYVEGIVEAVKGEINEVIDIAQNGTDEEKLAKVDEYIAAVTDALVEAGVAEEKINAVVELAETEIAAIAAIAEAGDVAAAEAKAAEYIANVKAYFELTDEESAKVDEVIGEVKDEIGEIIEIVENEDDVAAKAKIDAYVAFIKAALGVTAEDEAKVAEIIADITALVEEVKGLTAEDVKAVVDGYIADLKADIAAEVAKLGHKHYEAAEGDLYVAIGANAEGIDRETPAYYELVADAYGIDASVEEADLADAALITFQVDAADVILGALETEADWSKYFTAEQLAVVEAVWAEAQAVIAADWEAEGNAIAADAAAKIKEAVLAKLPEEVAVEEADVDAAIAFCMPYIERALAYAEAEKDAAVDAIEGLDATVVEYAEKLAYAVVSYIVDTKAAIEEVQAINPEATLVVLGMYNNLKGVEVTLDGATVDAGEYFAYAVEAANLYYGALAAANGGFAFVSIDEAPVNGATIAATTEITDLLGIVADITANADGHEYIKDQIVAALECEYGAYESLDDETHAIKCSICGHTKTYTHDLSYEKLNKTNHTVKCSVCGYEATEAHDFDGNTCTLCGYVKSNGGFGGGGGGAVSTGKFVVKFETNGGSAIASVSVKKGEVVAEPAAPTKEGFVFDGWYTDKAFTAKYDFTTPVTKSFTLYAKWAEVSAADKFADLDKAAWYYEYVKAIIEKGFMNGVSETGFAPDATLTRGMFVTILHRVEGEVAAENAVAFADVAEGQWYTNAVKWASANGIVKGITETEFAPDAKVTREQMAAMIARYADYKKLEVVAEGDVTYTDSAEISEYAKDAVKTANKLGILVGNADGSFAPKKDATRAEAAALFVRLLGVLEK